MFEYFPENVQIVIASAALLIAGIEFYRSHKNIKITKFKTIYRLLSRGRFIYSDITRQIYKSKYSNEVIDCSFLISKKDWIPDDIKDLSYLTVEYNEFRISEIKHIKLKSSLRNGRFDFSLLPDSRAGYSENIRRYIEKNMFNGEGCKLIEEPILENGKLALNISKCYYFEYQDTCEYMAYQSVNSINEKSLYHYRCENDCLNQKYLLSQACYLKDLFDFKNRHVMIGLCVLTVIKNIGQKGNDYFLIHKRSDNTAEAMNTISLVPSGTLEWFPGADLSQIIEDGVTREYDEEVLGMSELEITEKYIPRKIWLEELGRSEICKNTDHITNIHFAGMGLDPLNTKMEIIVRLDIDASVSKILPFEELYLKLKTKISDGKTISLKDDVSGSYEGTLFLVPYSKENVYRMMNNKRGMSVFREAMRLTLRDIG